MPALRVNLKENSYDIVVGRHILPGLGKSLISLKIGQDAVVITHPRINRLHGAAITAALKKEGFTVKILEVPDGEKSKSAAFALSLFDRIAAYDVKKRLFVVALGGGVVGDLSGFVASCYKRGVPYIQVPTTLLAQIDSAIGGKAAVDLSSGKNLVGAFYQPRLVYSDVAVLSTLSGRQLRNGLAEAVKYGMICDPGLFEFLEKNHPRLLRGSPRALIELVVSCSRIKAGIVMQDEKEKKGLRTILNFGHTAGHAIEAAGGYHRYQHGEAVALGMIIASDISQRMQLLSGKNFYRLKHLLKELDLPTRLEGLHLEEILKVMRHDKKFRGADNRFVLARDIGAVCVVEDVPWPVIREAVQDCMGKAVAS